MRFYSKRNAVSLHGGFVHKQFPSADAAAQEAELLRALHVQGVAVPNVIEHRDNLLILEHLPGEPLPDLIERGSCEPAALALALCDWFAAFYAAVPEGEIRGDVNGRNFLFDDTIIYGVDFEELCRGPKARDAGRLAAFITTYETVDLERQAALAEVFMREFSERFGCGMDEIARERGMELAAMRKRRDVHSL